MFLFRILVVVFCLTREFGKCLMEEHHILAIDTYDKLCDVLRDYTVEYFRKAYGKQFLKKLNDRFATTRDANHVKNWGFKNENDIKLDTDLRKWIKLMLSNELYDFDFGTQRHFVSLQLNFIWRAFNQWPAHTPKPSIDEILDMIESSLLTLDAIDTPQAREIKVDINQIQQKLKSLDAKDALPETDMLNLIDENAPTERVGTQAVRFGTDTFELFENNDIAVSVDFPQAFLANFVAGENSVLIGRSGINNLAISDPMISRRHMGVMLSHDNTVFMVDFNSRNGTIVNNKRLRPGYSYQWKFGQSIRIGSIKMKLLESAHH